MHAFQEGEDAEARTKLLVLLVVLPYYTTNILVKSVHHYDHKKLNRTLLEGIAAKSEKQPLLTDPLQSSG
jgi:hypothetical protein